MNMDEVISKTTKKQLKDRTGEENINNQGLRMFIETYRNTDDIDVKFDNGYTVHHAKYGNFKRGNIKNILYPEVLGVGIVGDKPTKINGKQVKEYEIWKHMLRRCYEDAFKENHLSYKNVTCCKEWLYYPNFYEWLHSQDNWNVLYQSGVRFDLDKDIICKGNQIYSPRVCCLVPQEVNKLFIKQENHRGNYPIGVIWLDSAQSFASQCNNPYGKRIVHWGFTKPEDAFAQYKKDKEQIIKRVADDIYSKGMIIKKCYDAMMSYQVEITD